MRFIAEHLPLLGIVIVVLLAIALPAVERIYRRYCPWKNRKIDYISLSSPVTIPPDTIACGYQPCQCWLKRTDREIFWAGNQAYCHEGHFQAAIVEARGLSTLLEEPELAGQPLDKSRFQRYAEAVVLCGRANCNRTPHEEHPLRREGEKS